ncbi:Pentatricopeptide repeat-containing protein [Rhynchospora pubera]|uniref:Pentatricopeptide repeat-containing protein n=1 Tax=Rhynchospora pubera TaxID=906938 RepID=A0AAV8HPQ2_9POAL|nr:Pentatricopeptide repeat-containing protein [Rhynchospora pubera]
MAMLTKTSKLSHLLRLGCSKRSIPDKPGTSTLLYPSLKSLLSTNRDSNRHFRGDRSGRRGEEEAAFLQSLDFGDATNDERPNRANQNDRSPPPFRAAPNRQVRGDRSDPSRSEFPDPPFYNSDLRMGRETRSQAVDPDDFFLDSMKDSNFQSRNQPIKDRFKDLGDSDKHFQSPVDKRPTRPHENDKVGQNWRAKALGGTGETLFEKLRLGEKNPDVPQTPPVTDEAGPTEADSSPPPPQEADEIFRKMKETGLIPNAVSMLDGLCKDGLVQEAMKLFAVMREKGTIPEVVIYTAVVEAFCKCSRFDDAIKVFRKMQRNGVVPNAYSYGVIVNGLCKGERLAESEEFCVEMFEAGHVPNPATFVGLVDEFCKAKGVEEGQRIVKKFQERNFAIDEKSIREHLDKKGPFDGPVWEVIFGKKARRRHF